MNTDSERNTRGMVEEITVKTEELIERVKELIREGNVRRLIIKTTDGRVLIEMPVTAGVFIGSVATILAPVLVVLGTLVGIFTKLKIVIERNSSGE